MTHPSIQFIHDIVNMGEPVLVNSNRSQITSWISNKCDRFFYLTIVYVNILHLQQGGQPYL
jgi:hypothetical protein